MLLLLACVEAGPGDTADGSGTTDTDTAGTDTGDADTPSFPAVTGVEACGSIRFLVSTEGDDLAFETSLDVYQAAVGGTPVTATASVDDGSARLVAMAGIEHGDVCSSAEEFPPMDDDVAWRTEHADVTVTFTPSQAWPADDDAWSYDGTVLGEATLELGTVILVRSRDGEDPDYATFTFDEPFVADLWKPDLPA